MMKDAKLVVSSIFKVSITASATHPVTDRNPQYLSSYYQY